MPSSPSAALVTRFRDGYALWRLLLPGSSHPILMVVGPPYGDEIDRRIDDVTDTQARLWAQAVIAPARRANGGRR